MAPHKYPMISMPEAMDIVLSRAMPLDVESIPFPDAIGRVLASDVTAPRPHPPFPASIMDGYAVRAEDVPGTLRVVGAARAGAPHRADGSREAEPGQAVYITTGAPVPPWADAVVPIERVEKNENEFRIAVAEAYAKNANIRVVGSDVKKGEIILCAGDRVGPHELGIAALAGLAEASVRRKPKLAVLSTGDELVDPYVGVSMEKPGSIFDANRHMLLACAREAGCDVLDLGIARDDPDALSQKVSEALDAGVDIFVASGGVSEGDKDHLKDVLGGKHSAEGPGAFTGTIHFGRVMMKPGKPLTFAELTRVRATSRNAPESASEKTVLAFGLPGNPVSAAVTFALTVAPAARRMLGWTDPRPRRCHAVLAGDVSLDNERPEYHRATLEWDPSTSGAHTECLPLAVSVGRQISSRLTSMRGAEVLLELPRGPGSVKKGSVVSALVIRDLGISCGMQRARVYPSVEVSREDDGVLGAATALAAGLETSRPSRRRFADLPNVVAVVTHPRVDAAAAESAESSNDVPDGERPVSDEGNDDGRAVLQATRRVVEVLCTERGIPFSTSELLDGDFSGDVAWRVVEAVAENGTSFCLAETARLAARTASIVLIAPSGPGAVSSQAAVVTGTDLGFPGLAPRMRFAVESKRNESQKDERAKGVKALADESSGAGVNAGQVTGAVVASLPAKHGEEALLEGLRKMFAVPKEKWEGLVM